MTLASSPICAGDRRGERVGFSHGGLGAARLSGLFGGRPESVLVGSLSGLDSQIADRLKRDDNGLIAAIVQQHDTAEVLMLAWMDDAALRETLQTRRATYFSRSRQRLWTKGETSGHVQHVKSVALDCDGDAVLLRVDQVGPACHTGTATCFTDRQLPLEGEA